MPQQKESPETSPDEEEHGGSLAKTFKEIEGDPESERPEAWGL
jgi:hypothetical protein